MLPGVSCASGPSRETRQDRGMPAKTGSTRVPYVYPWAVEARSASQPLLALAGLGFLAVGAAMSLSSLAQEKHLEALVSIIFFGMVGIACLGAAVRIAKPRGSIQFINAVVLTEAEAPPADSWVHLVRFRRANAGAVIIIFAIGLGLLAITAVGVHHVLTTSENPEGLWRLVPAALLGGLGVPMTVAGVRVLLMNTRTTSVGTRPVGVAVGESGIMLNLPGLDAEIPWAAVDSIKAGVITVGRGRRVFGRDRRAEHEIQTIDIRARGKLHCLTLASLATPPLLAYSALKFYLDNPSLRDELGTTVAQTRFDEWHAAL